jgi:small conductance mechanosensitive channel
VVIALLIFFAGRLLARIVASQIRKALGKAKVDETLARFGGTIVSALITIIAVIAALTHLGVQVTSLVAVLGAATLAVGLALRDSLSNFAAGAMLMVYRPIKVGDFVEAGGQTGIIEAIGLFHTLMRTTTNQEITIPNSRIYGDVITNYSARDRRRIDITVGISYRDDIDKARSVIKEVIAADQRIHGDPAPIIWVGDLGESSVDLWVKAWTDTDPFWDVRSDLIESIKTRFDKEGITIPFPQRDMNLYRGTANDG